MADRGGGFEVFSAPKAFSESPRFAYRRFTPIAATPGSGYVDYWRGPGLIGGVATSLQATGANFTYPIDLPTQAKFVNWTHVGFSVLVLMITEQLFSTPGPLIALSPDAPANGRVLISRYVQRWPAGNFSNANSGFLGGFFIGPGSSASIIMPGILNNAANGFIGVIRSAALGATLALAYKPVGGARVEIPIPGVSPFTWHRYEHRMLFATAQRDALYELFIDGVSFRQISFSTPGTPRYAGSNNGVMPVLASDSDGGFDPTAPTIQWRDWELSNGAEHPATFG